MHKNLSFINIQWVKNSGTSQLDGSPATQGSFTHLTSVGGRAGMEDPRRLYSDIWGLSTPPMASLQLYLIGSSEYLYYMAAGFPEQKLPDFLKFITETGPESFPLNLLVKGVHKAALHSRGWKIEYTSLWMEQQGDKEKKGNDGSPL